jgi:hypothetical protein
MLLKNVGLICDACGAGKHYDCIVLTDPSKHMCLCNYTTHPYLSREQMEKPLTIIGAITTAGEEHGKEIHPGSHQASRLVEKVR